MARRSSARLRSQNLATPQRASLSHDVDAPITRTPRTLPTKLASLKESDEMPGAFPDSPDNSTFALNTAPPKTRSRAQAATPTRGTPIKPAAEEMHPQLHHQTTAKPRDEARYLGFSKLCPHTEPPKHTSKIATLQATPSKARDLEQDIKSPSYQFTFRREHSLELSPEAKKLMNEKREEAVRIREQMAANGEAMPSIDQVLESRRIAKPKGRFSQAHSKEFDRMESIAAHSSALRVKHTAASTLQENTSATKSRKRKPSKAGLDQPSSASSSCPPSRDGAHNLPATSDRQLPRSTSTKDLGNRSSNESSLPVKRIKRTDTDDVSTARPPPNDSEKRLPSTPQGTSHSQGSKLSHLTTPTHASLARTTSLNSTKGSKISGTSFIPAKATHALVQTQQTQAIKASPALLARSPSKPHMPATTTGDKSVCIVDPLLARTPLKTPLVKKRSDTEDNSANSKTKAPALLSRSPMKTAMLKIHDDCAAKNEASSTPLLARSPSKLPLAGESNETRGGGASSKLLGRFNLLRQSPVKSILRSPHRLYSDDPAKVAAGTHFSTPPKDAADMNKALSAMPPATAPVQKHVDFTSSTKAREAKAQSSTPSKTPTPSPKADRSVAVSEDTKVVSYPDLSRDISLLSPSPQKRRQTSGPGDFTFRAGDHSIIFGQTPKSSATTKSSGNRPSTIRVVSSDQARAIPHVTGSKKRKFDFENTATHTAQDEVAGMSDKENIAEATRHGDEEEEERRPAKRVKQSASQQKSSKPAAAAPAPTKEVKRTTLGVKAKGAKTASPVKRSNIISQARLNALSQPKRR